MQKRATSRSKHLDFIVLDILCVGLSFFVAHHLRLGNSFDSSYRVMSILMVFVHMSIMFMSEGYSGILRRDFFRNSKRWYGITFP